jgi:MOSC domain-containing protein YiiM
VQKHTQIHGGPRKAVLLVSIEDVEALAAAGFAVNAGALGENLTVSGIDFRQLRPGQRFLAGGAVLELTTLRRPCNQLDIYNTGEGPSIQSRVCDERCKAGDASSPLWAMAGFYAAVVQPGPVRPGDMIALADYIV